MKKLEKIINIIEWIIIILGFSMIVLFVLMCVKLSQYNKCRDLDFKSNYCEKYKNF